jgi:hypothetical protein
MSGLLGREIRSLAAGRRPKKPQPVGIDEQRVATDRRDPTSDNDPLGFEFP